MSPRDLLSPDALDGATIAVSISDSPDLGTLGLTEDHVRFTLGEVARVVLRARGRLIYGGALKSGNYTDFLIDENDRYGHPDSLVITLPWHEHRSVPLSAIKRTQQAVSSRGRVVCLGPDGAEDPPDKDRGEDPAPDAGSVSRPDSLSTMRRSVTERADARLVVGGRLDNYQGKMPGVVEEALVSIQHEQSLYIVGGFGGAAALVARAVGLDNQEWAPSTWADRARRSDLSRALEALQGAVATHGLANTGLDSEERLMLSATPRPSEIASLVARGLGRLNDTSP